MYKLMAVFSNAHPGRKADFNDWYTNIHIRDVMRLPGSIAVQRFVRSERQPYAGGPHEYLALYEIGDRASCTKAHLEDVFSPRMLISDAFRFDDLEEGYMDPLVGSTSSIFPEGAEGGVIAMRLNAKADRDDVLESWFTPARIERLASLPGVAGARLFRHSAEQIVPLPCSYSHLAVLRIVDPVAAIDAWRKTVLHESDDLAAGPVDWTGATVTIYDPLFARLSAREVVTASAADLATEQRARIALGDRYYRGFPPHSE